MRKFYKFFFLSFFLLISSQYVQAQCEFKAGDIAFTGYQIFDDNNNEGPSRDDAFSFVLLRDAPADLEISFTDLGWTSGGRFQEKENAPSDGVIKWKALVDIPAGTQITITTKFNLTASIGEVTGVQSTQFGNYMDLGIAGDQLFAFTGTITSPILLAGININKPNWDNRLDEAVLSSSSSVKPLGNNVQYISIGYQIADDIKAYNAVIKPGNYSGKVPSIITQLNNFTRWETDDTKYPDPIPGNFTLPANATFLISPPEITSQPKDSLACLADKPVFSVSVMASEACTYFWEVSTDGVEYTPLVNDKVYSGVNDSTLKIENVESLNGNLYRVKVKGAVEIYSKPAKLEVIIDDLLQSGPTGDTELIYGEETTFSFTVSKYASDFEWHVSKDKGLTFQVIAEDENNYEGVKTSALTLVKPSVAMSGYRYRLLVSDKCDALYSDTIALTVVKKELIITAKDANKTYNGLPFTEVEVESYTGFEYEEDETVLTGSLVYNGEEAINVSDDPYDIIVDGLDADNYDIVYEKGELTIEPVPLTITANTQTKVYGEANPTLTFVYDGLVNGETSIADIDISTGAKTSSSVDTYDIEVSGTSDNYAITFVNGKLSVTPKSVTVTAEDKSKVYGEANPILTLVYDGLVNGETSITGLSVSTDADKKSRVGSYDIEVTGTSTNYAITFVNGKLSITPKAVTVTAGDKSKVYGESNPEFTLDYEGLVNDETSISGLSLTTLADENSPVGEYDITLLDSAVNYSITFIKGVLTITPKALRVRAENKTKVYGDKIPALTVVYEGLVNDESSIAGLSISTLADASSPVGDYAITVTGGSDDNYDITFMDGTLSVSKKSLTVSAKNSTKLYGDAIPTLTLTYDGLVNGETSIPDLTVSTTAVAGSPVGKYPIKVSGTSDNYSITFIEGTLSVAQRIVRVMAENKSKNYGDINPSLTLTYQGLVNGETSIPSLTVSTKADAKSPVGDYDITISGDADNYMVVLIDGVLSITARPLTVRAENKTKVYGESNPVLTFIYEGLPDGESKIDLLWINTTAIATSPVGKYPIIIGGFGRNYDITFVNSTLDVTPKVITVSAEDKSKVYGEVNPELTVIYSGLVNGETSITDLSISTLADANSSVGDYIIKVSASVANSNYTLNLIEGTLRVTPKAVTVSAENKAKVYGESNPVLTSVYDGLVNGETSITGVSVSTIADESSPVGDYTIQVSGTADNYTITFLGGVLSVYPKSITITANNQSKSYGEADPKLNYTVYPGLIGNDRLSGELNRELGEQEGKYLITQNTLKASTNYVLSFIPGELTIEKKKTSEIGFRNQSFTYNGKTHRLSVDGLPEGAQVVYENNDQTNAGIYTVTAKIRQNNADELVLNATLTILKANATIQADEIQSHVYDGNVKNVKAILNHNEGTLTYSLQRGYSQVGNYEITVYAKETKNYFATSKRVQLRIQQGSLDGLVFKDKEVIYNGEPQSILLENIPTGTRVEYSGNGQIDAGTYTITARVIDPNFKEYIFSANLIIRKSKQQITFEEVGTVSRNIGRIALKVYSNSGLPVTLESDDNLVATIDRNDLLIHRLGTARLIANQEGDKNYEAATSVSRIVRVTDEVDGSVAVHPAFSPNGDGINDFLIIEGIKDFPENKVRIVTRNGMEVFKIEGYDNAHRVFRGIGNTHVANGTLPEGTYFYLMEYKEDGKWKMKNGWFVLKNY